VRKISSIITIFGTEFPLSYVWINCKSSRVALFPHLYSFFNISNSNKMLKTFAQLRTPLYRSRRDRDLFGTYFSSKRFNGVRKAYFSASAWSCWHLKVNSSITLSSEENISLLNSIWYGKFSFSWSFTKRLFLNFGSMLTLHGYPTSLQLLLTSLVLFSARNVLNALSFTSHFCMLNHLVWRYVCVLLISKRTGSHRPRKHKNENCNATSGTPPASAVVAVFSSSPANFSWALNIFDKRFFTTPTASPLSLHRVFVMRLTPWPVTEVRTSQWWVDEEKIQTNVPHIQKTEFTSTEAAWTPAKFGEWFVQATNYAFLLISLIRFWTPVCRPAITAASSYVCPLQF